MTDRSTDTAKTVEITVNDQPHMTSAIDVTALVKEITGKDLTAGIAVAIDGEVVPASQWCRALNDGETVDILNARQGG
ncbi:sulfur carrier protein ThiS [Corynebacterium pseudodiphtheriticum]|uniref:sulfur carrier protein ThiS n=1 Tax=Corynebacterium pseudodiphtheriticum TaxID=37637 RepID=UPI00234E23B9|nr:sulfur carrier protein ThiS [Corynebacterium pseudodiphtheriticum]MDC7109976.1 sulfur carrier protein ThiS [Corynebacterium pseudodiphtheriticum]MDC7114009.1 sulfur carrier protein ThiS [Corynebacterium pseudodiphtheriticum]